MMIIADNHADGLLRPNGTSAAATLTLDVVAADLRTLYGDAAADLPEALVALARRLGPAHDSEDLAA